MYAYCANNPVNYVDPSGHKRRVYDAICYKYWYDKETKTYYGCYKKSRIAKSKNDYHLKRYKDAINKTNQEWNRACDAFGRAGASVVLKYSVYKFSKALSGAKYVKKYGDIVSKKIPGYILEEIGGSVGSGVDMAIGVIVGMKALEGAKIGVNSLKKMKTAQNKVVGEYKKIKYKTRFVTHKK